MTKDEAIQALNEIFDDSEFSRYESWYGTAMDMAIEALSSDAVSREDTVTLNSPISIQTEMVAVVRCKDCTYKRLYDYDEGETKYYYCALEDRPNRQWSVDDTDYCSWGERREE